MDVSIVSPAQASQALRQSSIPGLRRLIVEESLEALVITGRVQSYYYKQLAQETILPFLNGRELHNRVQVVRQN